MISKPSGRGAQNTCFLSYSTEHREHARFLKDEIEEACTVRVFVASDPSNLAPGADWYATLLQTLRQARATLLLVSPSSVSRPWLLFESGGAIALGHTLIPLLFGGLDPTLVPGPLAPRQACSLCERDSVVQMLQQLPSAQRPSLASISKGARSIVEYFRDLEKEQAQEQAQQEAAVPERPLPSLNYRLALLGKLSETQRKLFFFVRSREAQGKQKGVLESEVRQHFHIPYEHDARTGLRLAGERPGSTHRRRELVVSMSEYYFRLRELYHLGLLEMEKVAEFENRWSLNAEVRQILR